MGTWHRDSYFEQHYEPLRGDGTSATRVYLGFHVAPNEEIAHKIIAGNFAILAELDPGFFGQARAPPS